LVSKFPNLAIFVGKKWKNCENSRKNVKINKMPKFDITNFNENRLP
jgi:hypothetical protein